MGTSPLESARWLTSLRIGKHHGARCLKAPVWLIALAVAMERLDVHEPSPRPRPAVRGIMNGMRGFFRGAGGAGTTFGGTWRAKRGQAAT